jgi:hypothetical protein
LLSREIYNCVRKLVNSDRNGDIVNWRNGTITGRKFERFEKAPKWLKTLLYKEKWATKKLPIWSE